eukprot:snap_masked-scaffold_53-processed-gene-1.82-mRNA-1 protein AED:0.13 eAED:0.13 QI:0/-1/0/1/-1/1/1/0/92
MTKGTSSFGKKHTKSHTQCRRCGKKSFHKQKKVCASCGFGHTRKMRRFHWSAKAMRRRTEGTGRMRYLKLVRKKYPEGIPEPKIKLLGYNRP